LLTETDALGRETSYTYDTEGRVLTVTAPDAGVTTRTYGPSGPLTITDPISRTTTLAYTAAGKVETITDPRSKTTTLDYDAYGDLESVTDPLSHVTTFGYDAMGRRTTVTDALEHTTTTAYDSRGRVTRITNHDGTHTDFGYDLGGRRTGVTDPMGRKTSYLYDVYGRLERAVDPLGGTTRYGYDLMSNLVSLTDAKGNTTAFAFDEYRRVERVTYAGGALETFAYDDAGRLSTKVDRKGVTTTYSYDGAGRLTGKSYSDGTPSLTYTYDLVGRVLTAANGANTLTWTYDLAGQLLTEESDLNDSTVAYTNDAGGNRLTLSLDGSLFVSYAYDDASRLVTNTRGSNTFGFQYDAVNRRTSMTYPNGTTTTYTYDTLNRLLRLKADKDTTPITDFQYTYDDAGDRTRKEQIDYTEDYAYDLLSRLTGVQRTGSSTGTRRYRYDPVGNRLGEQVDGAVKASSYNDRNQLLNTTGGGTLRWSGTLEEPATVTYSSATVNGQPARILPGNMFEADVPVVGGINQVTLQATDASGNVRTSVYEVEVAAGGAAYTYDPNGNLTTRTEGSDTWGYEWNAENQLTKVEKNSVEQARFSYDPLGRSVEKAQAE
jgi:YD repeat-containing protein